MKWILLSFYMIGVLADLRSNAPETIGENAIQSNYRLNEDIWPEDYTIEVTPYFEDETGGKKAFTFDGICTIKLKTFERGVNKIVLHINDLEIKKKSLKKESSTFGSPKIVTDEYDNVTNKYTLHLSKPLNIREIYTLRFVYTGVLQSDNYGFYRSSYIKNGRTKWLASTQLEPFRARKVFPCSDEPKFKAKFNIIINRPAHFQSSLSNTALKSSVKTSSSRVRETFATTPKMSTYLVAIIVSEFQCRQNTKRNFDVCSRPEAYDQTKYSFDIGQKIVAGFGELLDYNYYTQISKMTMAAVPDFGPGAMENWGLLIYRENALLYDSKVSTSKVQQSTAEVIAHEQAHMWFGDLVTCDWWSHTWLNEGFATYFQYIGAAIAEKRWALEQQFTVEKVQTVFGQDSLEDTQPLSTDVNTPEEIQAHFGGISYSKGGSVIRMFHHALGDKIFYKAIRNYLKTNALKTATPEKLFAAFQREVKGKLKIKDVMGNWVYKAGYPLITVNVAADRKTANISQKRFLLNNPDHDDQTVWNVPINFASAKHNTDFSNTLPNIFLSKKSVQIEFKEAIDWIVLNVQQTGYYRVNYDNETWSAIAEVLLKSHEKIHALNRAQIIDDALNLARSNQIKYEKAFETIEYLTNETDYVPWKSAFNNFDFILGRFKKDDAHFFQEYVLHLLQKVYDHLGFKPKKKDSRLDVYNRMNVLKYACKFGHEKCIKDARSEYDQFVKVDGKYIEGGDTEWDYLWNKFEKENIAAERTTILEALGCTKKDKLIKKYLALIVSPEGRIRLHNKHPAFVSTMKHQQNLDLVLDFVIEKHDEIDKAFENKGEVPKILSELASRATTDNYLKKIRKFADANDMGTNEGLQKALGNAQRTLEWADKHKPIIRKHFVCSSSATTNTISLIAFMCLIFVYLL